MNAPSCLALLALMAQAGVAAPEPATTPSRDFLEYLGTFEPDDEETIVEFALEAEEAAPEDERSSEGRREDSDDSA